jgi:hypothetical protein
MKGIIFAEFLELVEGKFGLEMVDTLIEESNIASEGVYTSIGTYEFSEMLTLLTNLKKRTGIPVNDLLHVFATHFFKVLLRDYKEFILMYNDPFSLLASIESHIHVEVMKLYPDAELPTFKIIERSHEKLILNYTSSRAMYSFGLGLMENTLNHFNQKAEIILKKNIDDGSDVDFTITKK